MLKLRLLQTQPRMMKTGHRWSKFLIPTFRKPRFYAGQRCFQNRQSMAQSYGVVNQNDEKSINETNTPTLDVVTQVHSYAIDQVQIDNADSGDTSSLNQISVPSSSSRKGKRKLRSVVWNDFAKFTKDGKEWARCHHCKSEFQAASKNGTTSLKKHLGNCMKRKCKDIRQQLLGAKGINNDGTVTFGNFTFDQELSKELLARMIVLHNYPLSIVDHKGFREFVHSLQPLFKFVGRTTMTGIILKMYASMRMDVYKTIDKNGSRVALTTDMWTSNQNKGYMAVTAHYIDHEWKLQKRLIRFVFVPTPHNKENLSETFEDVLLEWNIEKKLSTLTVDNCSTNDAMIEELSTEFLDKSSLLLGTPLKVEKFEEAAKQLKVPCERKLILDCKTRWNSTYFMLKTAIEYRHVFNRLKQREKKYKTLPDKEEWDRAIEVCDMLKLFNDICELFSGSKYPTANLFFPKMCELKASLAKWKNSLDEKITALVDKMQVKFNKYWDVCSLALAIAFVLDPRYKLKAVAYTYPRLYQDQVEADLEFEKVKTSIYDLLNEYISRNEVEATSNMNTQTQEVDTRTSSLDPFAGWDSYVASTMSVLHVKSELDYYLEEPVLPRVVDFDILNWWKSNKAKYPTLAMIARDILAIPISIVASESAFSMSERLISRYRSKLKPNTIEAIMCCHDWMRAEERASSSLLAAYSCLSDSMDSEST